jgi:hypothetical protein
MSSGARCFHLFSSFIAVFPFPLCFSDTSLHQYTAAVPVFGSVILQAQAAENGSPGAKKQICLPQICFLHVSLI